MKAQRYSNLTFDKLMFVILVFILPGVATSQPGGNINVPDDDGPELKLFGEGFDSIGEEFLFIKEALPPEYRKVGLNGFPLTDEKPQSEPEDDYIEEETYIDAANLSLVHRTTDIYVPIPTSDLSLSVRRNWSTDIGPTEGLGSGTQLSSVFGPGWSTNLVPFIKIERRDADQYFLSELEEEVNSGIQEEGSGGGGGTQSIEAEVEEEDVECAVSIPVVVVQDELGQSYSFISDGDIFIPVPSGTDDADTLQTTLVEQVIDGVTVIVFTKSQGTKIVFNIAAFEHDTKSCVYDPTPIGCADNELAFGCPGKEDEVVDKYSVPGNDFLGTFMGDQRVDNDTVVIDSELERRWYRADYVEDRYGNRLKYAYNGINSLIPSTITYQINNNGTITTPQPLLRLTILTELGRIKSVEDPKGNKVQYFYSGTGGGALLARVVPLGEPVAVFTEYGYRTDIVVPPAYELSVPFCIEPPYRHININSIRDQVGNTYLIDYHPATATACPMQVAGVDLPGPPGAPPLGHATFTGNFTCPPVEGIPASSIEEIPPGSGGRRIEVIDTEGNKHMYEYLQGSIMRMPSLSGRRLPPSGQEIVECNQVEHNRNYLLRFRKLIITHYEGTQNPIGFEEFDFTDFFALSRAKDLSGNVTSYQHNDVWNPARFGHSGPGVGFIVNEVSSHYRDPTSETNALGGVRTYDYIESVPFGTNITINPDKQILSNVCFRIKKKITDEEGRVTEYGVDILGRRISETIKEADGSIVSVTQFKYEHPVFLNFLTEKRVLANLGGVLAPGTTTPTWNNGGGAIDIVTEYTPDAFGNVATEKRFPRDGIVLTTTYTYDDNNNRISVTDARGGVANRTTFLYDCRNRLVKTTHPQRLNLISGPEPRDVSFTIYDDRSRKFATINENGQIDLFKYDALNRLTDKIRIMGTLHNPSTTILDAKNCIIKTVLQDLAGLQSGDDIVEQYGYNSLNSRILAIDPNGNQTDYFYDALQRLVVEQRPTVEIFDDDGGSGTFKPSLVHFYDTNRNTGGGIFNTEGFRPTTTVDSRGFVSVTVYDKLYRAKVSAVQHAGVRESNTFANSFIIGGPQCLFGNHIQ